MYDEKKLYPKIETGFVFKIHMNEVFVEAFNNKTFNQDGNESSLLRMKHYNPPNPILQDIPVKAKLKTSELKE